MAHACWPRRGDPQRGPCAQGTPGAATPWSTTCRRAALDAVPGTLAPGGFSHPDIALCSKQRLFHVGPLLSAFSPACRSVPITVPSWCWPNCTAFPRQFANSNESSQPFPAGSSWMAWLCPGQIAKGLDLSRRRECQGRGKLASPLFFLGTKHAFKSQSHFTGKGWNLLETSSCPSYNSQQGHVPSPALCMFCRYMYWGCVLWSPASATRVCMPTGHAAAKLLCTVPRVHLFLGCCSCWSTESLCLTTVCLLLRALHQSAASIQLSQPGCAPCVVGCSFTSPLPPPETAAQSLLWGCR